MDEMEFRTLAEEASRKAAEQARFAVMRNMGEMVAKARELWERGADGGIKGSVSFVFRITGEGRANIENVVFQYSHREKYKDCGIPDAILDTRQLSLPGMDGPWEEDARPRWCFRRNMDNFLELCYDLGYDVMTPCVDSVVNASAMATWYSRKDGKARSAVAPDELFEDQDDMMIRVGRDWMPAALSLEKLSGQGRLLQVDCDMRPVRAWNMEMPDGTVDAEDCLERGIVLLPLKP